MPRSLNCLPLSEIISAGTPNLAIQCWRRADAQVEAWASGRGTTSGYLVKRSMMVNGYVMPWLWRRDPTRSTWRLQNLSDGGKRSVSLARVWRWILEAWQSGHSLHHLLMSRLMPCHTKTLRNCLLCWSNTRVWEFVDLVKYLTSPGGG